jgi:hypothetical protein
MRTQNDRATSGSSRAPTAVKGRRFRLAKLEERIAPAKGGMPTKHHCPPSGGEGCGTIY